jgi:hypothetical protein
MFVMKILILQMKKKVQKQQKLPQRVAQVSMCVIPPQKIHPGNWVGFSFVKGGTTHLPPPSHNDFCSQKLGARMKKVLTK